MTGVKNGSDDHNAVTSTAAATAENPAVPAAAPQHPIFDLLAESAIPFQLGWHLSSKSAAPPPFGADLTSMVLVRVADGNRLTVRELQVAIQVDGEARNLPWRLVEEEEEEEEAVVVEGQGEPGETGEMVAADGDGDRAPPPRAVRPLRAGEAPVEWEEPAGRRNNNSNNRGERSGREAGGGGGGKGEGEGEGEEDEEGKGQVALYGYSRFVLTFAEPAEARRFARAWHMKEVRGREQEVMDGRLRVRRSMTVHATPLW